MSAPNYPCPSCGKETKATNEEHLRICSVCRKVALTKACTAENAPPPRKDPFTDTVGTKEDVQVGLSTDVVPPNHPCPKCGKETKEGHEGARRCRPCSLIIPTSSVD